MISGIYIITNLIDSKYYIGSSKNIKRRLREHKNGLIKNKHENKILQYAVNKYGIENFTFEDLEYYEEEYIVSMEQYWMNLLQVSNRKYGYNIQPVAYSGKGLSKEQHSQYGTHRSDETKEKLRIAHTGMRMSPEHKSNSAKGHYKSILQLDLNDNILKEFISVKEATEFFNGGAGTITKVLKGIGKTAYGYKWKYNTQLQ